MNMNKELKREYKLATNFYKSACEMIPEGYEVVNIKKGDRRFVFIDKETNLIVIKEDMPHLPFSDNEKENFLSAFGYLACFNVRCRNCLVLGLDVGTEFKIRELVL